MYSKEKTDFVTNYNDDLDASKVANSENILTNSLSRNAPNYLYLQDHNLGRAHEDEESHYYYVAPGNTSKTITKNGFFRALVIFLSGIFLATILIGGAVLLLFWKQGSFLPSTLPSNSSLSIQKVKAQSSSDDEFPRFCASFLPNSKNYKKELNKCRREFVLNMTREAWAAYSHFSWGNPTLLPVSERGSGGGESFFPGGTIIAAMSTLWIMGLKEEWAEGMLWIEMMPEYSSKITGTILCEEYVIDLLGGLLSAYALSGKPVLLEKASEVYRVIEPVAFNNQTGLMANKVNPKEKKVVESKGVLASIGFEQPELHYLAALTGDNQLKRWMALNRRTVTNLAQKQGNGLLLPTQVDSSSGQLLNSLVAPAQSASSSFLFNSIRSYAQQGGKDRDYELLRLYNAAVEAMQKLKLVNVLRDGLTYVRDYDTQTKVLGRRMPSSSQELASSLAIGSSVLLKTRSLENNGSRIHDLYLQLAINITETCYQAAMATTAKLIPVEWSTLSVRTTNGWFLLANTLSESYFYLWRLTGNELYRERAWRTVESLYQHCRTASGGYTDLVDVTRAIPLAKHDYQAPGFLSHTLKFLWLIYADGEEEDGDQLPLPLDKWIFADRGHPLPVCGTSAYYPKEMCQ